EKCAKEHTHEVIEKKADNESNDVVGLVADVTVEKIAPNASVAPEQMSVDSSNSLDGNWGSVSDQVHDAVNEPETVVTEKENLEEPKLEKQSNERSQKVLVDPDSIWTEKTHLDAPIVKESTPDETVLKSDSVLTEKEDLDGPQLEKCAKEHTHEVIEKKADNESNDVVGLVADFTVEKIAPNASVAPEQMSVDSSNSLDGNWGSVSGTFFISLIVKLYML
nr:hypothetical protein [Tanacetum cinerariifolium]